MLKSLFIRDFAIIESLEVDFADGMSALTGETGAGKSIIIDAIGLVLGDRAENSMIRHGAKSAEISLQVEVTKTSPAARWLKDNDFDTDQECILRRVLRTDGKSRAYIDGIPVPLKSLRELGERTINIYGQHAHQTLIQTSTQRELVDRFAGCVEESERLRELYTQWKKLHANIEKLRTDSGERQATLELLRYQVEELDQLSLEQDEPRLLENQHSRLSHAGELKQQTANSYSQLENDQGTGIYELLAKLTLSLEPFRSIDKALDEILSNLESTQDLIKDSATQLRDYSESIELDPEELARVEDRLQAMDEIARKHHIKTHELPALHEQLQKQLTDMDSPDYDINALEEELATVSEQYKALAKALYSSRAKAAKKLSAGISKAMETLGMKGGRFKVEITYDENSEFSATGLDKLSFLVNPNPGQTFQPLGKIASGGELSRISLAIQILAMHQLDVPSLIFDEVDAGVGGATADVVGGELRKLGEYRQVFCITHLPQVAAKAHNHYNVKKVSDKKNTSTSLTQLSPQERIQEIARMLGGVKLTDNTLAHAEEMLAFED